MRVGEVDSRVVDRRGMLDREWVDEEGWEWEWEGSGRVEATSSASVRLRARGAVSSVWITANTEYPNPIIKSIRCGRTSDY